MLRAAAFLLLLHAASALAATAGEINAGADAALAEFRKVVPTAQGLLAKAKAVLIFPNVIKAGIGIGGEYGEGALRIDGRTVAYYSTAAASIGFQLGAQSKRVILLFMTDSALSKFRSSDGWEVGVDGSVAVIDSGVGEQLDTTQVKDPIVAFIYGQKGLMVNLTLEGSKFTPIKR